MVHMSPKVSPPVPKPSYPSATIKPPDARLLHFHCTVSSLHSTRTQAFGSGILACCWDSAGRSKIQLRLGSAGVGGCKCARPLERTPAARPNQSHHSHPSTPVPPAGPWPPHFASISRVRVGPGRPSIPSSATWENRVPQSSTRNATQRKRTARTYV